MTWNPNQRKKQLPANWAALRKRVLARDGAQCCYLWPSGQRCPNAATHVDHIVRGGNHSMENLQALCAKHHFQKSSAEGRAAQGPRPTQRRPPEPHPGLID
jgi:5-methylcytosine-specific restriction endonuclease McrA